MRPLLLLCAALSACSSPVIGNAPAQADFERDRKAILAMAGEYHVDFRFDETVALRPGYKLHEPEHTEAHEFVELIEDRGDFISLQHVLVEAGHVTKHWRQDWSYQQTRLWAYAGDSSWQRRELTPAQAHGAWVQTVWQVDDSPRYAGVGRWSHEGGVSAWTSDPTWRPLPRREHTVRSDYDVLVSVNRHTITPQGWAHEQDSYKLDRKAAAGEQRLVREVGINRYTRVQGYDYSAGREYWRKTAPYWATVRAHWSELFAQHAYIGLRDAVDERPLFEATFAQANDLGGRPRAAQELSKASGELLAAYLVLDEKKKAP